MLNRRALNVALGLTATLALYGTALAQEVYIPLVSKGFQHQFWQAVKQGAEQAAKEYKVKVTFEGPETEAMVDKQIDMLTAALAKNPKAIGFAALDSKAAIPLLKKAHLRTSQSWHSTRVSTATSPSPPRRPTTWPLPAWLPTRWPN